MTDAATLNDNAMDDVADVVSGITLNRAQARFVRYFTAVLIDLNDVGTPEDFLQLYAELQRLLVARYGRPERELSRGDPVPDLFAAVNSGRFFRITEWVRPEGTIRLGIPRRLDGVVRIEIQFAREFPPPTEPVWGLQDIR